MKPEKLNFTWKHSDVEQRQVGLINCPLGLDGANGNEMAYLILEKNISILAKVLR
jgi:hypothetical protein